jgi:hypothetical protein
MIKIEVRAAKINTRNITSKQGKSFTFREQPCYAFTLDRDGNPRPYPQEFVLNIPESQPEPYPVGVYTLAPASVWIDRNQHLSLAPKLTPVK